MRHCTQCGQALEPGSRYCDDCGAVTSPLSPEEIEAGKARYCGGCGAILPQGRPFCPLCGTPAGLEPAAKPAKASSLTDTLILKLPALFRRRSLRPTSVTAERRRLGTAATLLILLLCIGIAAVFVWQFLPLLLPGETYPLNDAMLYVQDGSQLLLYRPEKDPYTITGTYKQPVDTSSQASGDGRYLAYRSQENPDQKGANLYLLDLSRLGKAELQPQEGLLLAENVTADFRFSRKGTALVFLTANGQLCIWRNKALHILCGDVADIVDVNDRQVLYQRAGSQEGGLERHDLYLRSLDPSIEDETLIAKDIAQLLDYTKTYSSFVYSQARRESEDKQYTYEISYYDVKQSQTTNLASGVNVILDASAEQRVVLYAKEQPYAPRYDDIVDDPLSDNDARMRKPQPDDFGLPENYQEIYEEEQPDNIDRESELAVEDAFYENYMDYRRALVQYEEKLERDAVRRQIRVALNDIGKAGMKTYSLFAYREGASHILEEEFFLFGPDGKDLPADQAFLASIKAGGVAYRISMPTDIQPFSLEDWEAPDFDITARLSSELPQYLCWSSLAGETTALYFDNVRDRVTFLTLTEAEDGIVFLTRPQQGRNTVGNLQLISLSAGVPAEPVLLDADVNYVGPAKTFNGALVYTKSVDGNRSDLYTVLPGQPSMEMAADIAVQPPFSVENAGKTMLYYRRFGTGANQGYQRGDLYLYIRQERMIIGDVYSCEYRDDKLIYLVRNRDAEGKFELQVYREGGVSPVAASVTQLCEIQVNT